MAFHRFVRLRQLAFVMAPHFLQLGDAVLLRLQKLFGLLQCFLQNFYAFRIIPFVPP
jgi:hypothetical protein